MHLDILNKRVAGKATTTTGTEMDASGIDMPADPQTACNVLIQCYADGAGTEALLRAFISERNRESSRAQFWVGVYRLIAQKNPLAQLPSKTSQA